MRGCTSSKIHSRILRVVCDWAHSCKLSRRNCILCYAIRFDAISTYRAYAYPCQYRRPTDVTERSHRKGNIFNGSFAVSVSFWRKSRMGTNWQITWNEYFPENHRHFSKLTLVVFSIANSNLDEYFSRTSLKLLFYCTFHRSKAKFEIYFYFDNLITYRRMMLMNY